MQASLVTVFDHHYKRSSPESESESHKYLNNYI